MLEYRKLPSVALQLLETVHHNVPTVTTSLCGGGEELTSLGTTLFCCGDGLRVTFMTLRCEYHSAVVRTVPLCGSLIDDFLMLFSSVCSNYSILLVLFVLDFWYFNQITASESKSFYKKNYICKIPLQRLS